MLLLGIDVGTSSIKVSVVDAATRKCIATTQYPDRESPIISLHPGWAEQSPEQWWEDTKAAIQKLHKTNVYDPLEIKAIGIAYQMHGLVIVNKDQVVLRNSIIWCDSRAVELGNNAFKDIGSAYCLNSLLNSPGNFTASKLAWVKQNEPITFKQIDKIMLPGDFICMRMTGECTTTPSALSEGILWNYEEENLSVELMEYYGFDNGLIPELRTLFSIHGHLNADAATKLSLTKGVPVTYKAGDQLNNALSLHVVEPGQVAATAGTSGVIFGVTDQLFKDPLSRVNTFVHVNHKQDARRLGVLLCINGTGIMNRWIKEICAKESGYDALNQQAASIPPGSEGMIVLPFGNGAERMLGNRLPGAKIEFIELNKHTTAHLFRAVQEGISFAFRYGLDILRENGLNPTVIRAGRNNMFLSDVFTQSFVHATNTVLELYENDGSMGAALGAGIGAGIYSNIEDAFGGMQPTKRIEPAKEKMYEPLYHRWKEALEKAIGD